MTGQLKRLFIVADISQSGLCREEGRYPAVYVPIAKVASPPSLPDSLPSIAFHGHKGGSAGGNPPHGAWWLRHHVASAGF